MPHRGTPTVCIVKVGKHFGEKIELTSLTWSKSQLKLNPTPRNRIKDKLMGDFIARDNIAQQLKI